MTVTAAEFEMQWAGAPLPEPPVLRDVLQMQSDFTPRRRNNQPSLPLRRVADVQPEPMSWLWPGWLPLGKLAVLEGDPGAGKSTLALTIAATVTQGGFWPDGSRCEHPGAVVVLSAEDGLADTIRPRLEAACADLTRVHAVELDCGGGPVTLADPRVEATLRGVDARLLVVDVLAAFLPAATDAYKDADVRRILAPLADVAARTRTTVLLLRHLRKAGEGKAIHRGGGSIGIIGAARSAMLAAPDPDDPTLRVLASVKSNLALAPPSITYRLVDDPARGCAVLRWVGLSGRGADDLLVAPGRGDALNDAAGWLREYLAEHGGSAPSAEVKRAAAAAGISVRTLARAARVVGVIKESGGYPRGTTWRIGHANG
jgi:hypothetical protein